MSEFEPCESDSDFDPEYEPPKEKKKRSNIDLSGNSLEEVSKAIAQNSNTKNEIDEEIITRLKRTALFDGKFYVINKIDGNNIESTCQKCGTCIKGPFSSTSNFLKHFRNKHPGIADDYQAYKLQKKQELIEAPNQQSGSETNSTKTGLKQKKLVFIKTKSSQSHFDKKIVKFIVDTMSPTSLVEHDSFKDLFVDQNVTVMSRRSLVRRIEEKYKTDVAEIIKKIANTKFVCTTADIWSGKRRSFLGVTCHWLDGEMKRHSVALACRRFSGSHTYDKITDLLEDIYSQFEIHNEKLVACITDNASNFIKAFKEFGVHIQNSEAEENSDLDTSDDSDDFEEVEHTNLARLPKHFRCASHTLNLIATTDVNSAINSNSSLRLRHEKIFQKCNTLWNKAARPKSAEIIQDVLGHTLSYPSVTRWNSLYDSISQILSEKNKLKLLCEKMDIKDHLKESEIHYLEEYCTILKPLADTIDFLQGEDRTFFGYLLPSVISLRVKLEKIKDEGELKNTKFILQKIINGLEKRFATYFTISEECSEQIIGATTIPSVKTRWLSASKRFNTETDIKMVQKLICTKGKQVIPPELLNVEDQKPTIRNKDDFFDFDEQENELNKNKSRKKLTIDQGTRLELELLKYLDDPRTDIIMLNDYPIIKYLFIRFNTGLPSSAPVERLFSFATYINTPRRNALSDKLFEKLVLLKANKLL